MRAATTPRSGRSIPSALIPVAERVGARGRWPRSDDRPLSCAIPFEQLDVNRSTRVNCMYRVKSPAAMKTGPVSAGKVGAFTALTQVEGPSLDKLQDTAKAVAAVDFAEMAQVLDL